MNYMPSVNCSKAAIAAAGEGNVTADEVLDAFQRADAYRQKLDASGQLTGRAEKMRRWAEQEAQKTKIAAAMQRRHAALNVLKRQALEEQVNGYLEAGIKPQKALLAVMEGTLRGVKNGRKSVAATVRAFERDYAGEMLSRLEKERPHLAHSLGDRKLDDDITREMWELRDGGTPGITKNADAQFVAKTFSEVAELARTDLNKRGASIGKLNGWAGVQVHDDLKLIKAGRDAWVGYTASKLDVERTFPEGLGGEEMAKVLGDVYDTIITGISNQGAAPTGRVNPANLAKSLGKSRVLHFKDADAAIAYRDTFGYGTTVSSMVSHFRKSAKAAGAMEVMGPNPEMMLGRLADDLKRRLKADPNLTDKEKTRLSGKLDVQHGALKHAVDIAIGNMRPVDADIAQLASNIRAAQGMAKLGAALWSSIGDTITAGTASQFRGSGFAAGVTRQWAGILAGRPKGEQAEIAYLIGEGFDGLLGHVASPYAGVDTPAGLVGRLQEQFFRWNGLTWWTDVNRAVAGRVLAAEMGMHLSTKGWGEIKPQLRHVLETHGFDETSWNIMKQAGVRLANGKPYMTPDRIGALPDEAFAPLLQPGVTAADARRQMQIQLRRFYGDETSNAVIENDARTQRTVTQGTKPGTWLGEVTRMVMQFKGYPITFTRRVLGRELFGLRKMSASETLATHVGHMGTILAGLAVAGYMSMVAKDTLKGYWPPRDPTDPRTWLAALQQGGGLGIYGDYLFAQTSRFGSDALSSAAGPTIGNISDLINIGLDARDAALSGGENTFGSAKALSVGIGNTPFANLFFVKPALDYLFLNSMREAASPGYLRRMQKDRQKQYGQGRLNPLGIGPTLAGDLAR